MLGHEKYGIGTRRSNAHVHSVYVTSNLASGTDLAGKLLIYFLVSLLTTVLYYG